MTLETQAPLTAEGNLASLHSKVDRLTEIVEAQERRQQELEELKRDLMPIANHAIKLSIDELAEIGTEFQVEDLLHLLKRLLRSTDLLLRMLDQMEALSAAGDEAQILGKQVFGQIVESLDRLERKGYFDFARGGAYVADQIMRQFSEEDVRALGDNVVLILNTVRNLTQPEIMQLTNHAVDALRVEPDEPAESASMWQLVRAFGDPQVRRGAARLLQLVKSLGEPRDGVAQTNGN